MEYRKHLGVYGVNIFNNKLLCIKKNVKIAYMPQNYDDKMNVDMSIIDYLIRSNL